MSGMTIYYVVCIAGTKVLKNNENSTKIVQDVLKKAFLAEKYDFFQEIFAEH